MKKNFISIGVGVIILGFLALVWIWKTNRDHMASAKTTLIPAIVAKLDSSVSLKEVGDIKEESGIYTFSLKLEVGGQEQKFTSYMTKDGKYFFTGGVKVADLESKEEVKGVETEKKLTCEDIKKADTSNLTAYIVADCPYGLQMQRVMKMAIAEEPRLAKYLTVKYIGSIENGKITSMHGDKEAQENLRQICIREEQKDLYWPYVSCYMKEGKSVECVSETRVNQTQLQTCMNDAQKGLSYAQKDFDAANALSVSGSPTLSVNGMVASEFDFGGRNADSLKTLVCCGQNTELGGVCKQILSKDDAAVSYSVTDKGQVAGTSTANCATQ